MLPFFTLLSVLALTGAVGIAVFFKLTDAQAAMYARANLDREEAAAALEEAAEAE